MGEINKSQNKVFTLIIKENTKFISSQNQIDKKNKKRSDFKFKYVEQYNLI